jgi:hypothetical protein
MGVVKVFAMTNLAGTSTIPRMEGEAAIQTNAPMPIYSKDDITNSSKHFFVADSEYVNNMLFGTDSDQNRMLEEIRRSGSDSLPL